MYHEAQIQFENIVVEIKVINKVKAGKTFNEVLFISGSHRYIVSPMSTKRIVFLDLARGLAIFFMIMQHAIIMYAVNEGAGTILGDLVVLSGTAPAAPVFMLIMGIFFLRAQDMRTNVLRGLKLIGLGYLLNLVRFVIPTLLTGDYPASGPDSPLGLLMTVDILQMAGLSLICMNLIRRTRPLIWLGLALLVALISPLLWQYAPRNPLLDILWGTHHNVAFPFFPWVIYPLIGMYWGGLFNAAKNLVGFMRKSALVGAGLMLLGGTVWMLADTPWLPAGDYSRCGIQVHLVITGFVLIWLWLIKLLEEQLNGSKPANLMICWSKNVTIIYLIQWVLFGWGVLIFDYQQLTPGPAAVIGLLVAILTHGLVKIYNRLGTRT